MCFMTVFKPFFTALIAADMKIPDFRGHAFKILLFINIDGTSWPVPLPTQVLVAIRSSVQGAQIAAQNVSNPQLSRFIISTANEAFTSGMAHALFVGGIIMVMASIVTLIILPAKVRPYKEES